MTTVRSSYGDARYGYAGHDDAVYQSRRHHLDTGPRPPVLVFPEHANAVFNMKRTWYYAQLLTGLSRHFTVCAATPGGTLHWGGATGRSRVTDVSNYLNTNYGTSGKFGIVGISMGSLLALNFVKANPSAVAWLACILPALNLADLKANSGYASEIDAAYGGNYTDATYGATSSPYYYRATYPASTVPTAFFTASNDDIALPQWADAFLAAQPSVYREDIGPMAHTEAGIAAGVTRVLDWVQRFVPDTSTGAQFSYPEGGGGPTYNAPVLESRSSGTTGSNTSAIITIPPGTVAGDLLIMALGGSRGASIPTTNMSGWTKIAERVQINGTAAGILSIYAKIAVAGESSGIWLADSGNTTKAWICERWSGAAGLPAVQTPVGNSNSGSQTMVLNEVATTLPNTMVASYLGLRQFGSGIDPVWGGGAEAGWNTDSGVIGGIYSGLQVVADPANVQHTVQFTNNQGAGAQAAVSLLIEPVAA